HRQGQREARGDDLDRESVAGAEGGAERLVAADDLVEDPAERRDVERAVDAEGQRDVVQRAARLELVEEPEPLLRERRGEGAVAGTIGPGSASCSARRSAAAAGASGRSRTT